MIGPSSSHTAGIVRIGNAARDILGHTPSHARIVFFGSLAKTYQGHGSDKAIVAGLMGFAPDDLRIRDSLQLADEMGLQYEIETSNEKIEKNMEEVEYSNTLLIFLENLTTIQAASIGGGNIIIQKVNGKDVNSKGNYEIATIHFDSLNEMIEQAEEEGISISALTLRQTAIDAGLSEDDVTMKMHVKLDVMKKAAMEGVAEGLHSISGLTSDWAFRLKNYYQGGGICGSFVGEVLYTALAVMQSNACMSRIVAAPTAGSCGILPGCLIALQNHHDISDDKLVEGMFNASAVGMVIAKKATLAGADGACQAECGSAAAMAASAITEIMGGTPTMCGIAAALALKSLLGLVCDPVAGLVEEPCIIRNASSAAVALASAEMALAGMPSVIPVDEVISAMDAVSKQIPASLRETAEGGVAATPTGRAIAERI